jgi:hypothetical protein
MKIRLLPEAESDLEIGADFYKSQQPGLGIYFNDCPNTLSLGLSQRDAN